MIFAPTIPFPRQFYGFDADAISLMGLPYRLALWGLNVLLPAWVIQKVLLFAVFVVAGLGAYMLCSAESVFGRFFAGFMYVLNPFVYVRFMVGHLGLLLAYSVFPFLIKSFVEFLNQPELEKGIKLVFLSTLILALYSHFVYIAGLVFVTLLIFKVLSSRRDLHGLVNLFGWGGVTAAMFVAMNLHWVVPLLTFKAGTLLISGFTYQDLLAFTSRAWGTGVNIFFTLASLYGFWRVPEGYRYVSETLLGWLPAQGSRE